MSIFSKRYILYTSKKFLLFQFAVFKGCNTFDSNSLSFIPSCPLEPTNNCFCATESNIDLQTILPTLWTIGLNTVTYIKLWSSVKDLQINTLKFRDTFHCRHAYIRYLQIVYFFKNKNIFPVLIDNSNNFEINKLINLVENGMFHFP